MQLLAVSSSEPSPKVVPELYGSMDAFVLPEPLVKETNLTIDVEWSNRYGGSGKDTLVFRILARRDNRLGPLGIGRLNVMGFVQDIQNLL